MEEVTVNTPVTVLGMTVVSGSLVVFAELAPAVQNLLASAVALALLSVAVSVVLALPRRPRWRRRR